MNLTKELLYERFNLSMEWAEKVILKVNEGISNKSTITDSHMGQIEAHLIPAYADFTKTLRLITNENYRKRCIKKYPEIAHYVFHATPDYKFLVEVLRLIYAYYEKDDYKKRYLFFYNHVFSLFMRIKEEYEKSYKSLTKADMPILIESLDKGMSDINCLFSYINIERIEPFSALEYWDYKMANKTNKQIVLNKSYRAIIACYYEGHRRAFTEFIEAYCKDIIIVGVADSGGMAVEIVEREKPNLVIFIEQHFNLDGYESLPKIRKYGGSEEMTILYVNSLNLMQKYQYLPIADLRVDISSSFRDIVSVLL